MKINELKRGDHVFLTDFSNEYIVEEVYPNQGDILVRQLYLCGKKVLECNVKRYLCRPDCFKSRREIENESSRNSTDKILRDVDSMLNRGTSFANFFHNGKRRHVLIGTQECGEWNSWGERVNRAIVKHRGKFYLVAVDLLEDRAIKHFDISKITNWME